MMNVVAEISYPTAGYSNQKLTQLSFMVTDVNIYRIRSMFNIGKNNTLSVGDVVILEVFLVFTKELLKQFTVTFPNHFNKKFTTVTSTLDKYQKLIDVTFHSECKQIKTGRTIKEHRVNVDLYFCGWKMELPVTVKVYEHEFSKLPTISYYMNNFHLFVNGENKGNLTSGVDDATYQTLKYLGLKTTPKFRKQSVADRMSKYYRE